MSKLTTGRILGVEAHIGIALDPPVSHIVSRLQDIYEGESMTAICSEAAVHFHSRLAEQGFFPDDDVMLDAPAECWQAMEEHCDISNRELLKFCLLSLWAKHTW